MSTTSFVGQHKGISPIKGVRETKPRVIVRSDLLCESQSREMINPIKGKEVSTTLCFGQHNVISPIKGVDETQSRVMMRSGIALRLPKKEND